MSFLFQHVIRLNDTKGTTANDEFSTKDWVLKGLSTRVTTSGQTNQGNLSDDGKLFITLVASNTEVRGRAYSTFSLGTVSGLVATFTATNQTSAFASIVATNASGITGQVTVQFNQAHNDDDPIKLQCLFSNDADVSLFERPEQFSAWTPQHGLAQLHNLAAYRINEYLRNRFRSHFHGTAHVTGNSLDNSFPYFSNLFISPTEPDLAKIHNPQQLQIASAYYTLHLAYSRDFLGNTPDFDPYRSQSELYLKKFEEEISSVNIDFDLDKDGDVDDVASAGGIQWGRA